MRKSKDTLTIPTSLLTYTGGSTDQRSILLSLALELQLNTENCIGKNVPSKIRTSSY